MLLLTKIILAHLVGDFLLQSKTFVKDKEAQKLKSWKFYAHILIHGSLLYLVVWDIKEWPFILVLMTAHAAIDLMKMYAQKEETKTIWFVSDQVLHIVSILIIYSAWYSIEWNIESWTNDSVLWLYAAGIFFITLPTAICLQVLMSGWSKDIDDGNDSSLENAGKYIGILERLFVFTFVIGGNWEAIGFLLAAKSVFRFGDLKESKDRKLTEYILIGTLLSFGVAIVTGLIVSSLSK